MPEHSLQELLEKQSLPLKAKISITQQRIQQWVLTYGLDSVYVSFSGGKDSTVLLDIARKIYPEIKAVYVDTGLEYPEVREFVKTYENVDWLKPKMNFRDVIRKYGYPVISKEQSAFINEYRHAKSEKLKEIRLNGNKYGMGMIRSAHKFLINAPFEVSDKCCDVMKKKPVYDYEKKTGRKPIMGTMASESRQRASNWIMYGCNAFDAKRPTSKPMSVWTEQDVLLYIRQNNISIAKVYGEVLTEDEVNGQLTLSDYLQLSGDLDMLELFESDLPVYCTTGCKRTGCVFCGYGAHLDTQVFANIEKVSNKAIRDFCMRGGQFCNDGLWRPTSDGLGMWFVLQYMNIHGGFDIEIPEYERYEKTYGNEMTRNYLGGTL